MPRKVICRNAPGFRAGIRSRSGQQVGLPGELHAHQLIVVTFHPDPAGEEHSASQTQSGEAARRAIEAAQSTGWGARRRRRSAEAGSWSASQHLMEHPAARPPPRRRRAPSLPPCAARHCGSTRFAPPVRGRRQAYDGPSKGTWLAERRAQPALRRSRFCQGVWSADQRRRHAARERFEDRRVRILGLASGGTGGRGWRSSLRHGR